jgi:NADH:ubiquinone oxidoreductase subunit 4 (subunit M)
MVFAGVAKTFGLYGLLRIGSSILPAGAEAMSELLFVLGMVNVLYAAWATMRQKDWNRLVAYASISHAGYTFIALSAGTSLGQSAAVVLMFGHGLVTSLGFLLADELTWATGQNRIDKLGGLAKGLPVLSVAFCLFAIAGAGFPGSATFVAELMVFFAAWGAATPLSQTAAVVCVFGVILSATYLFRALHSTFFGEPSAQLTLRDGAQRFRSLPLVAVTLLVLTSTAVGVWPRLITDLFAASPTVEEVAEVSP